MSDGLVDFRSNLLSHPAQLRLPLQELYAVFDLEPSDRNDEVIREAFNFRVNLNYTIIGRYREDAIPVGELPQFALIDHLLLSGHSRNVTIQALKELDYVLAHEFASAEVSFRPWYTFIVDGSVVAYNLDCYLQTAKPLAIYVFDWVDSTHYAVLSDDDIPLLDGSHNYLLEFVTHFLIDRAGDSGWTISNISEIVLSFLQDLLSVHDVGGLHSYMLDDAVLTAVKDIADDLLQLIRPEHLDDYHLCSVLQERPRCLTLCVYEMPDVSRPPPHWR